MSGEPTMPVWGGGPEPPPGQSSPPQQAPWQQQPPDSYGWQQTPPGGQPYGWAPPPPRSRAPLVIGVIALIVLVVAALGALAFLGSMLGPLLSRTELQDLTVGQCFNGGRPPTASSVPITFGVDVIDCAEPHDSELIATFDYPGSGSGVAYPGEGTIGDYGDEECIRRFYGYIGLGFTSSFLEMSSWYPRERNWALGDYSIQCVVHPPVGQDTSTGSYRGSRR